MIQVGYSRGVLFSGNANNGANAGFSYANSNNAPSLTNANVSSQLCFTKRNFTKSNDLAARQKTTKLKKVLVGANRTPQI